MRIVIDLQGAQCENRKRGIGRYSMAMAQALVRNRGVHEVLVALNGNFPDTIEPIRAAFDGLLPQENIRVWQAPGPVRHLDAANQWRRKAGELVREAFLASLKPDMVYVTSLFEGLVDDAVTSIGVFSRSIPVAVTLYDLIPLIYRNPYLDNPQIESWYESKLDHLRRADLLLAISKSSQREAVDFLAFPPDRCVYVGTAADPQFKRMAVSRDAEERWRAQYGLPREFVMYTGGIDHRKNIEGLIRAFALLPQPVREQHQLAIICAVESGSRDLLKALCTSEGLDDDEVVLTGFVPEEVLIALYSLCKAFVFPSWHEGFGLPALEAMRCGAPVIAANTSSLPEVIGREDALFNPRSDEAIARKLSQVLTDDAFRADLAAHGLKQAEKFSWDASATSAWAAFEQFHRAQTSHTPEFHAPRHRPKMAYISPLPPARSGIADYSAELLPELARFYEIEVIGYGQPITNPWVKENCKQRTVEWFEQHAAHYQRVLYHFGNSDHHQHMFDLLEKIPGVVVLHDFFLSGIVAHMDVHGFNAGTWACELYDSYGYAALQERFHAKDTADVVWKYPCNKTVVDNALGIIVHADYSRRLASKWLAPSTAQSWSVIPLLRVPARKEDRIESRTLLGLRKDAFLFCSFGLLGPSKHNQRLIDAWMKSPLSQYENCYLIFVGQNDAGNYGSKLVSTINDHGLSDSVSITGWVSTADYHHYLAAADVGVQLRTLSRGETSAAVLDCMNYGLPTIVNANGSMADLPADSVCMLEDNFDDTDLQKVMETLYESEAKRAALETRAREVILTTHSPRFCAEQYVESIEIYYEQAQNGNSGLIQEIAKFDEPNEGGSEALLALAKTITQNQPPPCRKQLLLDISELVREDSKSGIQRVVRSVLLALLTDPPEGFRVEPVYALPDQPGYRYARQFTLRFLNCPEQALSDDAVDVFNGDLFLGLDLQLQVIPQQAEFYGHLKRIGVQVYFVVYDLLPVQASHFFIPEANALFTGWLNAVSEADGLMCISRSTADDLLEWLGGSSLRRSRPLKIGWFHLGANVAESVPSVARRRTRSVAKASRPIYLFDGGHY
jgi:glycosyltransferase involved in cell wall biosynthesis